jgi:hypothetical protein
VLALEGTYVYSRGQRSGARGSFWTVWSAGRFDRQPVLPGERAYAVAVKAFTFTIAVLAMDAFAYERVLENRSALYTLPITGIIIGLPMVFVIGRPK